MSAKMFRKLLSLVCVICLVMQIAAPVFAADPGPADPTAFRLIAGDQNGNSHFGSDSPEAFVLSQKDYTSEGFRFTLKLNSKEAETRFRFVSKYADDQNWSYIGYDRGTGWYCQYKVDGQEHWPGLGLPKLTDDAQIRLTGTYAEDGLHLTLENLANGEKHEAVAADATFLSLKDKAGKIGFGAAKYGAEITDVQIQDLVIGEDVFTAETYQAMTPYQNKIGSWEQVGAAPDPDATDPVIPDPDTTDPVIPDPDTTDPIEPADPELITWARLVSGEGNGNGHFGSANPEAFVLTPEQYTSEPFSFVVKFNSETNDTRFRLVTRYIDDSNWSYIAFDGYQGKNHWFTEYKDNGAGGWPDVANLPALNKGDEIKFSGSYQGADLKLTVENLTTNQSGSATVSHTGIKAGQAGQFGFGAAQWGKVATDISVRDLVIGEKVYGKADYEAMTRYQDKVASWTVEQVKPADPNEGKLWYKLTGGSNNGGGHAYGNANARGPVLALDQSRNMTVGKTLSMAVKPSENWGMFYTYLDDDNWLYVGHDPTSKWYYQYKINGTEEYPGISGLPEPVEGRELTMSVSIDRETLMVNVNGTSVKIPNSKLLPFSENENLKNNGRFGIKTNGQTSISFTDVMLGTADCMADEWGFAANREGQALNQFRTVVRPLTGIVTDQDGRPIADASVNVNGKSTRTDETGSYTVNGLELGTWTIAVSAAGFTPYKGEVTITEAETHTLNVTLMPKGELDLSQFHSITDGSNTVYLSRTFPAVVRYVRADGSFFRGNEETTLLDSVWINKKSYRPEITVTGSSDTMYEYTLTFSEPDANLNFQMVVRIEIADGIVNWDVVSINKEAGCAPISIIDFRNLNLLTVSTVDAGACFDGAVTSADTTVSGDCHATFEEGFNPGSSTAYLYGFLTNGTLSAGIESNSTVEGDVRIVRNDGADYMALSGNLFYYERGDKGGQTYAKNHTDISFPVCDLPHMAIAVGGDINEDGELDWNDGALAYRRIMHRAYGNEAIKDLVNYRIIMNFASMHPDPYLQTADNLKKVYLATDGLPQALLLKGYGNEGHDSANSEYADIAQRQGGVEDFRRLIQIAHDYNTEVGIHINAQEAYPESKSFCPEMIGGPVGTGNGWGWLDQSHVIDKLWDLGSGARWKRLVQLYDRINGTSHLDLDWEKGQYVLNSRGTVDTDMATLKAEAESLPDNMDFIYLDVWYQEAWETREIARQINSLGWRFSTEFATKGEYDSTWQHWATEGSYGGAVSKGFNSDIIRFLRNDQRDSQVLNYPSYGGTADNPLLGGYQLSGFEGWGSQRDFGKYLEVTFNDNLPTKFLQHYIVTDWENYPQGRSPVGNHEKQITLADEAGNIVIVTRKPNKQDQRNDDNIERTITLNGRLILDDVTYLLPWTDNQDGSQKLYHWNLEGGETTWELDPEWASSASITVYKLTDQGRVEPQEVPVVEGRITLNAEPATAYVLVTAPGVKELLNDFGETDYVTDPGFNGYAGGSALDPADWTGDIDDPSVTVELSETEDQRLQFASPAKDVAVSTTIHGLTPGEDYVAEIYVQNDTNLPATLEVDAGEKVVSVWAGHSYVKNYVRCDNKSAYSSMQRMQVSFVAESDTAVLTLKRAAGEGNTYMDSIRIVRQKLDNYQPDGSFRQDFESVVQGLYPFVLGPAQGVNDPSTHLSQLHAPYTQYGWHNRVVDDVIDGNWSLKHHNRSTGIIYQTLPQNFRFEPNKFYTVEFDYQTGSDRAYAMVIGDDDKFFLPGDSQLLPITGSKTLDDGTVVGNTRHVKMTVLGAEDGNTWIGLYSPGGVREGAFGEMDFILDNLVIREDTTGVLVTLSADRIYKGETASITIHTSDPEGGVVSWDNSNPAVAAMEGNVIKGLSGGTTTLTATLSNGTVSTFEFTVVADEYLGIPGIDAAANSEETNGEGAGNGIARAAADNDSSTYWHTAWSSGNFRVSESTPAVITVDLGEAQSIQGIRFQQRPSGPNGVVGKYAYRILDADRSELLAGGPSEVPAELRKNAKWVVVPFAEPVAGARYIELSILQGHEGYASLAELQAIYQMVVADEAVMEPLTVFIDEEAQAPIRPAVEGQTLKGMVYVSGDPEIFTVEPDGRILPHKAGEAILTASNAAGIHVEAKITVLGIEFVKLVEVPAYLLPGEEFDPAEVTAFVAYPDDIGRRISGTEMELHFDPETRILTGSYLGIAAEPCKIPTGIAAVALEIPAPVAGETPVFTLDGSNYTAAITWDGALADGAFDYATAYTANITLTAADGFVFADDVAVEGMSDVQKEADGTLTGSVAFEPTAHFQGWFEDETGRKYFYGDGTNAISTFETIDGATYYFGADGYMVTGVQKIGDLYYYFDETGRMTVDGQATDPTVGTGTVTMESWVYDSQRRIPVVESETNGTENVTFEYHEINGRGYYSDKCPTDAGRYTVKATFPAKGICKSFTATAEFVIEKCPLDLTITIADKLWDGTTDAEVEVLGLRGFMLGDEVNVLEGKAEFESADVGEDIPVKLSGFRLTGADAGNYILNAPESAAASILENKEMPSFTDIDKHWGKSDIQYAVAHGLFKGMTETEFGPEEKMTRAMFVTVLGRHAGVDPNGSGKTVFKDVPEKEYFAPYVAWAVENGITQGMSDTEFEPNREVTREQMATFLCRYAKLLGIELEHVQDVKFVDADQIHDWARESVDEIAGAGLLIGDDRGYFNPRNSATRAEVATVLTRFVRAF